MLPSLARIELAFLLIFTSNLPSHTVATEVEQVETACELVSPDPQIEFLVNLVARLQLFLLQTH